MSKSKISQAAVAQALDSMVAVSDVAVVEQIKVKPAKVSSVFRVEGQGLSFGQYFKLAQNTARNKGVSIPSDGQAQEFFVSGMSVRELVAAI